MTNNININNNASDYWLKNPSPIQSRINPTLSVSQKQEDKDMFESKNKKTNQNKILTPLLIVGSILAIATTAIFLNKKNKKGSESKTGSSSTSSIPPTNPVPTTSSDSIKSVEDEIARLTELNKDVKKTMEIVDLIRLTERLSERNKIKGFGRLSGYDKEKKILIDKVCKPIANEKFGIGQQQVPASVLLYGPMGTGKTIFPKAVAGQTDCHYVDLDLKDTPEQTFKQIEEEALASQKRFIEEGKRTILHLDEIDSLARHSYMAEKLKQFMDTSSEDYHCTLFATTNYPDRIDDAFLTHNKLLKIPIPPADKESAAAIVKHYAEAAELAGEIKYEEIAEHIVKHQPEQAFSNDLIKLTVENQAIKAIRRQEKLSHKDLLEAFKAEFPDISKKALKLFAENIERLK